MYIENKLLSSLLVKHLFYEFMKIINYQRGRAQNVYQRKNVNVRNTVQEYMCF